MGEKSPLADAEMIALAIRSLQEAGLREFQIDLGQVAFFKGFMEEAGLTSKQTETFRSYVEEKNTLAMQLFLNQCAVPGEVSKRLMKLPQLYGDESVLKEARAITQNETCREALDNLQKILDALGAMGCAKFISIDLGMVHAVNYYSGMIFRGITGFLGQPLLSGGRYDGLPERFGRAMPATGFGLSVNLLMMALGRQGEAFLQPQTDFALGVDEAAPQAALEWAAQMRGESAAVALYYGVSKEELARLVKAGRAKAAAIAEGGRIAVFSGEEQVWK
jgi:ATP phosphoribosyltransferase regulatory subunit